MTVTEVYEKYKHLDGLLSDAEWMPADTKLSAILRDLWQTVKLEATNDAAIVERLTALCEYVEADIEMGIQLNAEWAETVATVREWLGAASDEAD